MSESPEVERGTQNPKGKTNIEKSPEPKLDRTVPPEPVEAAEESPQGNQMKNVGKVDKIGTA
jgi:hypothetical protein